jgi:trk system potassium uptake protein TrkH
MNYKLIFRLLSLIMGAVGLSFLVCLAVAFIYREDVTEPGAILAFSISAAVAAVLAGLFHLLGREAETRFFRKEALCVIGVGWILASLVGSIPYAILLPDYSIADAIFESTSGITTTGASVLSNLEALPRSLIFWRSLTQWMGGLGVVVFFVAILSFLGAGGKILFSSESSGRSADIEQGRVRKGVLQLFLLYLALSAACTLTLYLCGMSWYDSICHMFATVATGGYSTRSASVGAFNSPAIEWTIIAFMTVGGTNFFFLLLLARRNWAQARKMTEVGAYLGIMATAVFLFFLFLELGNTTSGLHHSLRAAAFQVVSIMTTTGFGTTDYNQWPLFTKMGLLSLMVIGGCSASTAGGLKVIRIVIAFRVAVQSVERSFRTHVVRPVMINGKPIDQQTQDGVVVYTMFLGLILLFSFPVLGFFESDHSMEGAVSAVVATLFNIGPGFAEFGPAESFSSLTSPSKIYLSLLMIMGRLELFAVLVLLAPSLWKKFS